MTLERIYQIFAYYSSSRNRPERDFEVELLPDRKLFSINTSETCFRSQNKCEFSIRLLIAYQVKLRLRTESKAADVLRLQTNKTPNSNTSAISADEPQSMPG